MTVETKFIKALKQQIRAAEKSGQSEGRVVGELLQDVLDSGEANPALVEATLVELESWAKGVRDSLFPLGNPHSEP